MDTTSRKDWVTGEEIMQGGVLAPSLGMACHEGILKAYLPELGMKQEIVDITKLKCRPRYPHAKFFNEHVEHLERKASFAFWDWKEILEIPKLKQEISDIEKQLKELEAISALTKEQNKMLEVLKAHHTSLHRELQFRTQPNSLAYEAAIAKIGNENKEKVLLLAWDLMKTEAIYFSKHNSLILKDDLQSIAFYFCYEMYEHDRKAEYTTKDIKYNIGDIVADYKDKLSKMWFCRNDVEKWITAQGVEKGKLPERKNSKGKKEELRISKSLWVGKNAEAVFAEMRKEKYSDEVIAYVLFKLMKQKKTPTGRLFYVDKTTRGIEHDLKTYQEKVTKLIKKCEENYSIILE